MQVPPVYKVYQAPSLEVVVSSKGALAHTFTDTLLLTIIIVTAHFHVLMPARCAAHERLQTNRQSNTKKHVSKRIKPQQT